MSVIRAIVECFPPAGSYIKLDNGTLFNGSGDYVLQNIIEGKHLELEYEPQMTPSNVTYSQGWHLAERFPREKMFTYMTALRKSRFLTTK